MTTPVASTAVPLHPQVDIEDIALKGLPGLFDGDWVWQEYCAKFGERSAPDHIRVRQLSHDPGRRAVVSYVVEWHPDEFIPPEQFAFELRRDRDAELYRYPEDPHLPGLSEAASVESALRLLNRHVLAVPARRVRVDMVRYRPSNRAVLRHRLGRFGFYVRVIRPSAVEPLLKAATLVQRSGFVVPRLAGHWPDGGVLWLSQIPGRNMRRYIRRGHRPPPESLLDGLENLWDVPMESKDSRPFNLFGAYRRARRSFVKALEGDEEAQLPLIEAVRLLDPFVKSWQPTHNAHNDFYDDQMLVLPDGRIALVDLEEAGPGDPMLDVGNFLAHLRWGAHFGREKEARAKDEYRELFQRSALERLGWNPHDLAMREAVCLFRICTNAIRHPHPDWRHRLNDGLTLVSKVAS